MRLLKRKWLTLLCLIAMLASLLTFAGVARALQPFAFRELALHEGDRDTVLTPDSVIDRATRTLFVRFTPPIDMNTPWRFLTVKDSTGADAPYTPGAADDMLYVTFQAPLKISETYTLTVRGGPDGLKDLGGNALAGDVSLRLHTNARPVENTLTVGAMDEVTNPLQTNVYKITGKAGPLKLKAAAVPDALFHVLIETPGPATLEETGPRIVFNGFLNDPRPEASVNLPADGQYLVFLTRFMADGRRGHGAAATAPLIPMPRSPGRSSPRCWPWCQAARPRTRAARSSPTCRRTPGPGHSSRHWPQRG